MTSASALVSVPGVEARMAVGGTRVEIAAEPEGALHPFPVVPESPVDRCLAPGVKTRAKKPVVVHGQGEREVSVDGEGPLVAVHRNPGVREAIRRIGRADDLHRPAVLELRLEAHGPALVDYPVIAANGCTTRRWKNQRQDHARAGQYSHTLHGPDYRRPSASCRRSNV